MTEEKSVTILEVLNVRSFCGISALGSNDCACIQTYGVWDIFSFLSLFPVGKTKSNGSDGSGPALSAGVPREEGIIESHLFFLSITD